MSVDVTVTFASPVVFVYVNLAGLEPLPHNKEEENIFDGKLIVLLTPYL